MRGQSKLEMSGRLMNAKLDVGIDCIRGKGV